MRSIKVSQGTVTVSLASMFAVSCLAFTGYTMVHVPAPPGSSTTALFVPANRDSSAPKDLALMKARVMAFDVREARVMRHHRKKHVVVKVATVTQQPAQQPQAPVQAPAPVTTAQHGIYSYRALETLWVQAGGSPSREATAACIAEHESGGNPNAQSPTDDFGLWQIHGNPAALNPMTSARIAVAMSSQHTQAGAVIPGTSGTNWSPWTTAGDCGV